LRIHPKYKPLFDLFAGKLPEVHTCVIVGGRESGKTFTVGLAAGDGLINHHHRMLYTRYTMKSAGKSIIPAFNNRLALMGYDRFAKINKESIESTVGIGKVDFAGIKTSSGNQTANLKSLEDYSVLIADEFEEWTNEDEFDSIELSLRAKDVSPFTVIVMNPTDVSHFAYKKFFEPNKIPNEFCGIVDGVLYIWSCYLDIGKKNVAKKNWIKFEKARLIYEKVEEINIEERESQCSKSDLKQWKFYKYKVLGHWNSQVDNLCIDEYKTFKDFPAKEPDYHLYGMDFGMSPDPTVIGETRVYGNKVYCKEHVYKNNLTNKKIAAAYFNLEPEGENYVVADSAGKNQIAELSILGVPIIPCKKGPDSIKAGIQKLNSMELFVHEDSENAIKEFDNYHYILVVNNKGETKVVPVDNYNHFIDQLRYTVTIYRTEGEEDQEDE
jgi:phage terminase large subunit